MVMVLPRIKWHGTTAQRMSITAAAGVIGYDTDLDKLCVFDGVTLGGTLIPDSADIDLLNEKIPTKIITCSTALYNTTLTGTVTVTDTSTTITGSGTSFTTELAAGDTIVVGGTPLKVQSITNNTSLITTQAFNGITASGQTAYKANNAKTIDLTGIIVTAGLKIIVNFTNGSYGYTPTLNGDLIYGTGGNAVSETMPAFFPAGCDIPFYRNAANTGWVYEKIIVKNYKSGASFYNLYSNGWTEQGSYISSGGAGISVTLLLNSIDTTYNISLCGLHTSTTAGSTTNVYFNDNITRTGFVVNNYVENGSTRGNGLGFFWKTAGYAQI